MEAKRLAIGFGWGLVATLAMSAVMVTGYITGIAPMPEPIPGAIVGKVVKGVIGAEIPQIAIMALAIASHFTYGGFWGAVLAGLARPVTIWKGLGLGVFLWLVMDIVVLPFLGWGFFGISITPRIAVATLILHLVYGFTLGWLMDRERK
jgi:hypothetical protein